MSISSGNHILSGAFPSYLFAVVLAGLLHYAFFSFVHFASSFHPAYPSGPFLNLLLPASVLFASILPHPWRLYSFDDDNSPRRQAMQQDRISRIQYPPLLILAKQYVLY